MEANWESRVVRGTFLRAPSENRGTDKPEQKQLQRQQHLKRWGRRQNRMKRPRWEPPRQPDEETSKEIPNMVGKEGRESESGGRAGGIKRMIEEDSE